MNVFIVCLSDFIDYVILECSVNVVVIFVDLNWSDVGSFLVFFKIVEKDCYGNYLVL